MARPKTKEPIEHADGAIEPSDGAPSKKVPFNFTKTTLDALPLPPAGKRERYRDSRTRGLTIVIRSSGSRTFFLYRRVDGVPEEMYIGPYPDLTIEQARRIAEEKNGAIALGENPNADSREDRDERTWGEVFEIFMEVHSKPHKKTWPEDVSKNKRHLPAWQKRKMSSITKADVRAVHSQIGKSNGTYEANRLLALISRVFNFAIADGYMVGSKGTNPAADITKFSEKSRDRRLHADELPAFFDALEAEPNAIIRDFILLALWTGARKGNVRAMRWEEVHLERGMWEIPMTKNGTSQTVPLVPEAIAVLERRKAAATIIGPGRKEHLKSPWVLPAKTGAGHLIEPKRGWDRILKEAGLSGLRIHDLRRTLGSWQVDTGASLAIVGKSLNHKSPRATAVYARLSMDPVREAMTKATGAIVAASKGKKEEATSQLDASAEGKRFRVAGGRIRRLVRSVAR